MKTNINNNHYNSNLLKRKHYDNIAQRNHNTNNYNTIRPAQAISFSGSAVSMGQKAISSASSFGEKIITNNVLNSAIKFTSDNEIAWNAIYSLIVAGILKPYCVIKSPGTEEKDKQYIATKNFLQAFIGSFISLTLGGGLIKKSLDVFKNNLDLIKITENNKVAILDKDDKKVYEVVKEAVIKDNTGLKQRYQAACRKFQNHYGLSKFSSFTSTLFKKLDYKPTDKEIQTKADELLQNLKTNHLHIFKKNPEFIKRLKNSEIEKGKKSTLYSANDSLWKNSTGWIGAFSKAKLASMMLPAVTAMLFADKMAQKQSEKFEKEKIANSGATLTNTKSFKEIESQFGSIVNQNNPFGLSFTGGFIDAFAKGIEHASMSKIGEKAAGFLAKFKEPSARMCDYESWLLTGYWDVSTILSKKIPDEQKLGLNVHTTAVTIVSSAAALLIDSLFNKLLEKTPDNYSKKLNEIIAASKEQLASKEGAHIETILKENCKHLFNGDKIASKIVENGKLLEGKDLEKAISKLANNYNKSLSKFKSLTIFTFVVRFLVPVLMVRVNGKLKKKINDIINVFRDKNNSQKLHSILEIIKRKEEKIK